MSTVAERNSTHQYTAEYTNQLDVPKTLGFDLLLEAWRIHEPEQPTGELSVEQMKQDRFKKNAETYINEALHVGVAKFDPYRIQRNGHDVTLTADSYNGPVREIFNPDNPDTKHKWPLYRKTRYHHTRALIEYERFKSLEKSLKTAEVGDTYIWISPPPYDTVNSDLSEEEKKKQLEDQGFGYHTNTFVFTVEDNNTLQGRVIQNYLKAGDHRELLRVLLNEDVFDHEPNELELLNKIAKLPIKHLSATEIKNLIDQMYEHTPDDQKIKPTQLYEQQLWADEEKMKQIHQYMEPFLGYVFQLLRKVDEYEILTNPELKDFIAARFHIWEQTVVDLHQGTPINSQSIQRVLALNNEEIKELAEAEIQAVRKKRTLNVPGNSLSANSIELNKYAAYLRTQNKDANLATGCGIGSGFSDGQTNILSMPYQSSIGVLPANYIGAEVLRAKTLGIEMRHEDYKCPKCMTKITGEFIGSHPSTWKKNCPNNKCKYEFKCAKEH